MPRGVKNPIVCHDCGGNDNACTTCGGSGQIKPARKPRTKVGDATVDTSVTANFIGSLENTMDTWQGLKRFIEDKRGCETESLYNLVMSKEYSVFCQFNHVMKHLSSLLEPYGR